MSNPSTIWSQLALPNPPVGSIPFVFTDGATIVTDVVNFFYTQAGVTLAGTLQNSQLTVAGGLRESYTDTTTTPGAVTVNKPAGRSKIAAGQSTLVVTCAFCFLSSIVGINIEGGAFDATATRFQVTPGAGSFTVTFNAAATAAVTFSWDILNVY